MKSPTALRLLVVLAVGISVLSACAPAPSPSPTPSPAFTSEEDTFAAAEATFAAYIDALNRVDTQSPATFDRLFELSSGGVEAADRKNFSRMHAENQTIDGETRLLSFAAQESGAPYDTVHASVCLDVSRVEITNPNGTSAVDPNRPDVYALEVTFERRPEGGFTVDTATPQDGQQCAGS